jgi:hypothetical protein
MAMMQGAVTIITKVMAIMACIMFSFFTGQLRQPAATGTVSAVLLGEDIPLLGKGASTKDAEPPPTLVGGDSERLQKSLISLLFG